MYEKGECMSVFSLTKLVIGLAAMIENLYESASDTISTRASCASGLHRANNIDICI